MISHMGDANIRDLVAANPWIEKVRLTWLWRFRAEVELSTAYSVNDYAVLVAEGWTIDMEYSYWGHVNGLEEYLDAYDVWADVAVDRCELSLKPKVGAVELVYRCPDVGDYVLDALPIPDPDGNDTIESMTSRLVHRRSRR